MRYIVWATVFCSHLLFAFDAHDLQKLKEEGDCPMCDLSGADLRNFNDAALGSAIFEDNNLSSSSFKGAILYKTIFERDVIGIPR